MLLNLNENVDDDITVGETIERYGVKLRVPDELGDERLADLRISGLKSIIARLLDDLAPTTVNGYIGGLKAMCNYAVDCGYLVSFNTRRLKKVRVPKAIPPCFHEELPARRDGGGRCRAANGQNNNAPGRMPAPRKDDPVGRASSPTPYEATSTLRIAHICARRETIPSSAIRSRRICA